MPTTEIEGTANLGASGRLLPTDVHIAPGETVTLDSDLATALLAGDDFRLQVHV